MRNARIGGPKHVHFLALDVRDIITCLLLLLLLQEPELLEVWPVEELVVRGGGGAAEVLRGAGVLVLRLPSYVAAKTVKGSSNESF